MNLIVASQQGTCLYVRGNLNDFAQSVEKVCKFAISLGNLFNHLKPFSFKLCSDDYWTAHPFFLVNGHIFYLITKPMVARNWDLNVLFFLGCLLLKCSCGKIEILAEALQMKALDDLSNSTFARTMGDGDDDEYVDEVQQEVNDILASFDDHLLRLVMPGSNLFRNWTQSLLSPPSSAHCLAVYIFHLQRGSSYSDCPTPLYSAFQGANGVVVDEASDVGVLHRDFEAAINQYIAFPAYSINGCHAIIPRGAADGGDAGGVDASLFLQQTATSCAKGTRIAVPMCPSSPLGARACLILAAIPLRLESQSQAHAHADASDPSSPSSPLPSSLLLTALLSRGALADHVARTSPWTKNAKEGQGDEEDRNVKFVGMEALCADVAHAWRAVVQDLCRAFPCADMYRQADSASSDPDPDPCRWMTEERALALMLGRAREQGATTGGAGPYDVCDETDERAIEAVGQSSLAQPRILPRVAGDPVAADVLATTCAGAGAGAGALETKEVRARGAARECAVVEEWVDEGVPVPVTVHSPLDPVTPSAVRALGLPYEANVPAPGGVRPRPPPDAPKKSMLIRPGRSLASASTSSSLPNPHPAPSDKQGDRQDGEGATSDARSGGDG